MVGNDECECFKKIMRLGNQQPSVFVRRWRTGITIPIGPGRLYLMALTIVGITIGRLPIKTIRLYGTESVSGFKRNLICMIRKFKYVEKEKDYGIRK